MASILLNGEFATALTSWTNNLAMWKATPYYKAAGCAQLEHAVPSACYIYQTVTIPALGAWQLRFALRCDAWPVPDLTAAILSGDGTDTFCSLAVNLDEADAWEVFSMALTGVPSDTSVRVQFSVADIFYNVYYLDYVALDVISNNGCQSLALELMRRRRDLGAVKHAEERYREMVNRAIQEAPRSMWLRAADVSLATVANTRRYSLATVADITEPRQVFRVLMGDSSDEAHNLPIGRWEIEDDEGVLTLALDNDPPEAGRTLGLEYIYPHPALDCADAADVTTLDREWLLAKAMTCLLLEADPSLEPLDLIARDLAMWDAARSERERQQRTRRAPSKARTHKWR